MNNRHTHLSHPKYRPDIDGLRALAVLAVVAFHAFPNFLHGGFIGVDVFFVISGYLISTIIFENLDKGTFSFTEFYSRRIRRIFPSLILVLLSCLAFGWFVLLGDELKELGKYISAGAGFVSNIVLWTDAGYFDSSAESKPLLHLWSLGIEEQFYIIWPIIIYVAWKRKLNLLAIISLVAFISFVLNVNEVKQDPVATFYLPQTRFWELLSGSLLAWIVLYKNRLHASLNKIIDVRLKNILLSKASTINRFALINLASLLGFLLLAYGFGKISKDLAFPGKWAMVPVLGTLLIIASGPRALLNRYVLSHRVVVWFGLISFPLYLWHWPLLSFARIIEGETPSRELRISAVFFSIILAWVTTKFVEKRFRFEDVRNGLKVAVLLSLMILICASGFIISQTDLSESRGYEKLAFKRKGFEHAFGNSLSWYRGKEDWLFLGNQFDSTVAKLKLSIIPSEVELEATTQLFSESSRIASLTNTRIVLIVGPNKSNIYPEYLPDELIPSEKKYSSYFLDRLAAIPNLFVYNPTDNLIELKSDQGYLYWKTDTHWNNKGAFLAYSGFSRLLELPIPQVEFEKGDVYSGDLIGISKLKKFPLHSEDNWEVIWKSKPSWVRKEIPDEKMTSFGASVVITNSNPLSNKYVWVLGDSFTTALRKYFNSTFKEVRYLGHWNDKLKTLPQALDSADKKPDIIFIIRAERSF